MPRRGTSSTSWVSALAEALSIPVLEADEATALPGAGRALPAEPQPGPEPVEAGEPPEAARHSRELPPRTRSSTGVASR